MTRLLKALLALTLIALVITTAGQAAAATTSSIQYSQFGRKMVYLNNPERLLAEDLATTRNSNGKGRSLLTVFLQQGQYRHYYEHLNATGGNVAFGVYVWNPSSKTIVLTRKGKGFKAGDYQIGAAPFVQLFNATESVNLTLAPSTGGWIFRSDLVYGATAGVAANGQFLTGAMDVDITVNSNAGESVTVHHLIYNPASFNTLPSGYDYIGYIQRMRPSGDPESRTYKGTNAYAEVQGTLNWTLGSNEPAQDLPVSYADYSQSGSQYVPGGAISARRWYTHDIPHRDKPGAPVVATDMLSFNQPGWGIVDPLKISSDGATYPGTQYPNLGNWGVVYTHKLVITNNSGRERTITMKAGIYDSTESDNAFIAYQAGTGTWQSAVVRDAAPVSYRTLTIPVGTSTHYVKMVLGAPSDGHLYHAATLNP